MYKKNGTLHGESNGRREVSRRDVLKMVRKTRTRRLSSIQMSARMIFSYHRKFLSIGRVNSFKQ